MGNTPTDFDTSVIFLDILKRVIKERNLIDGDRIRLIITHPRWKTPRSSLLLPINKKWEEVMAENSSQFI